MTAPTQSNAWKSLQEHQAAMADRQILDLFASDPDRFGRFSIRWNDWLFDYSKNRISQETMERLFDLAREAQVPQWRDQMFAGEAINHTEQRAVLHTALRAKDGPIRVQGEDVLPQVLEVREKMRRFSEAIRSGEWTGATGQRVQDIVNIGIGGSDLGPSMVSEALEPYWHESIRGHFVSNVDGAHMHRTLKGLDPQTTLFMVASKTFTTQETMANAHAARSWLVEALGEEAVSKHFVALSTNQEKVQEFGIDPANMFAFWDWVGGRYSVWSAIGLSVACLVGMDQFEEFLDGAREADDHFRSAKIEENIPMLMGLLGVWYHNFWGSETHAIIPYDQSLHRFAAYFQQGDMESNGKGVSRQGEKIEAYQTGPIVWGEPGTNGQHAFFQLLHQGTRLVPIDIIAPCRPRHPHAHMHRILLSNAVAQAEAFMTGKSEVQARGELESKGVETQEAARLAPYKAFQGNRPTNLFLFPELTPRALGRLVALYEHKIFVQGIVWNINSFDQMGVELGKELANQILPELESGKISGHHDGSTRGALQFIREWMG